MPNLLVSLLCAALLNTVLCEVRESRLVQISQGPVRGFKHLQDDVFIFYGIPYATAPTGPDKYKNPLPAPSWQTPLDANNDKLICPQAVDPVYQKLFEDKDKWENCLIANVYVPNTNDNNLPVLVLIHGGGFQIGSGNTVIPKKLVKTNNIIAITFNYRIGIHGFLCLGTPNAPGNAGLKDQLALLRWVQKNIASFGGNPNDVTLAGVSAGAAAAELLMLSPLTKGLFNKVIADSGSGLAVSTSQIDPIENAKLFARRYISDRVDDIVALEDFYRNASFEIIASDPFCDAKSSTFYFSFCVEKDVGQEMFLADCPYNILKSGKYEKVPMLVSISNMDGTMRLNLFDAWKHEMNKKFSNFLPHDLHFDNEVEREIVAKKVKEFYFSDKEVGEETILSYIDYFSDVFFFYPLLKSIQLNVKAGHKNMYLYEYSYVDELIPVIPHTDLKGAPHCAQAFATYDGFFMADINENDFPATFKKNKAILRQIWGNFIKSGVPSPEGSSLPAWPPTGADAAPHMSLGHTMELRGPLLQNRKRLWDTVYERHYRAPQPPVTQIPRSEL